MQLCRVNIAADSPTLDAWRLSFKAICICRSALGVKFVPAEEIRAETDHKDQGADKNRLAIGLQDMMRGSSRPMFDILSFR